MHCMSETTHAGGIKPTRHVWTRQEKKITSFQPAWLFRCSIQHQGQFPASSSRLHLRQVHSEIHTPNMYSNMSGCHMNCCRGPWGVLSSSPWSSLRSCVGLQGPLGAAVQPCRAQLVYPRWHPAPQSASVAAPPPAASLHRLTETAGRTPYGESREDAYILVPGACRGSAYSVSGNEWTPCGATVR